MRSNFKKSMFKPIKQRECKECKELFTPYNSLQSCCSAKCATELAKKKVWKEEKKKLIDKNRTRTEWLNLLQVVFNSYIRERDKDLPCITCGTTSNIQYHSGHFFSVGSYPNLRFHEDNAHKQCVTCNTYNHGNLYEYTLRLPDRIGNERFNKLIAEKDKPLKLTTLEIKELIKKYKEKLKELKKNFDLEK